MIRTILLILFITFKASTFAQSSREFMIGGGLDMIKSDINSVFDKAQVGFELNYFINRSFSVSGGYEIWSNSSNSFVAGFRWYAANNLFLRYRGLIGVDNFSFGLGYGYPVTSQLRAEVMGDYYVNGNDVSLRAGISYILRKKNSN
jgi:hypothetical protein